MEKDYVPADELWNLSGDKAVEGLKQTSAIYKANIDYWKFLAAAYNGGKEFINLVLEQHTRETVGNWEARVKEGVVFNYSAIVIDLFSFYLTEKKSNRDMGAVRKDKSWKQFLLDCDLYGTNFDEFINESQKIAAAYGAAGILVDKPSAEVKSKAQAVKNNIYPYCSVYTLPNILDWKYERDPLTNRPVLKYIKLKEFDGTYILWWENKWEVWDIIDKKTAKLIKEGDNVLGEIPFIWLQNIKNPENPYIGISDIKEISRITGSIVRNISCGDEVIKFAGFPMMRKPMEEEGSDTDVSGVQAILEFNPEFGDDGKPDWLESAIAEPIDAILKWVNRKIMEIFQMSHLSGVHAHEKSDQVRSGVAMRYEFQQLGRVLAKKSENLTEAELKIIYFWLKWQKMETAFSEVNVFRSKDFSVDDLNQNLENYTMSMSLVPSDLYKKQVGKSIARKMLPDIDEDEVKEIDTEIDKATFDEPGGVVEPPGASRGEPDEPGTRNYIPLAEWAKQNNMGYYEAYRKFKKGELPVESEKLPSGQLVVYPVKR